MGKIAVRLAGPLRELAGGAAEVVLEGVTVGAVVRALADANPRLQRHLFTSEGRLRTFVTVYLNDQDVRFLEREATALKDGDVVSLVPAVAGGAPNPRGKRIRRARPTLRTTPRGRETFSREELARYSRQLVLPEVGFAGQRKLRPAKVLLVGIGGLGAPAALYLAAAGVGGIGLVDSDVVELSNLHRQPLYTTQDVGHPKLAAAKARIEGINPGTRVTLYEERLSSRNALRILRPYDVIVDGSDNFPTRYLVNDAAVLLGKPDVYGSVYRLEGQVSVFDAQRGPCYRCLFPEPPPPELVPSCAEAGVLGVLPGLIGILQATETLKLLLGQGKPLIGRLLLFDALGLEFRELELRKNPRCALCSSRPTQKGLVDYDAFCGLPAADTTSTKLTVPGVEPEALRAELGSAKPPFLVDVREPSEWTIAHLPDAHLVPKGQLAARADELPRASKLVLYCRSGVRSSAAARLLLDLGFPDVRVLRGGINAWARRVDRSLPQY